MDYSGIIGRAWRITWKYRALWLFGFPAGGAGIGNVFGFNTGPGNNSEPFSSLGGTPIGGLPPSVSVGLVIAIFAAIVFLVIAFIVLSAIARGALIGMVRRIDGGEVPTVGVGLSDGFKNFLSIIGISIAIWLPLFVVAGIVLALSFGPALIALINNFRSPTPPPSFILLMFLGFIVATAIILPVAVVLGVLNTYAESFRVIEGHGVFTSISKGYRLLWERKGQSAAVWFIALGLSVAFGLVVGIVGLVMIGPAIFIFAKKPLPGILLAIPGIAVLTLASAVFQSFISSMWTLAFLWLSGHGGSEVDQGTGYAI